MYLITWPVSQWPGVRESGTRRHGVHKTRGFNYSTWNTEDVGTAGKTFNNRQTLTGRTGAFKDRVTRELRRHTWNQINYQHEGKTRSQGAHGEQNHNKTVQGCDISPPSLKVRPAPYTIQRGGGVGTLEASRDTETGEDRTGDLQCGARSGSHGGSGDSGGHGGAGSMGGRGRAGSSWEPDGAGRGSGEPDEAGTGSGEPDGAARGSGELDGAGTGGRWRGAGTGGRSGSAASRGRSGSAISRGRSGSATSRGRSGSAASRGRSGSAASRGRSGNAISRGRSGSAISRGRSGSAELDGTSGDEAELDGTSGDEDKLGGASGDTRGLVPTRDWKLPRHR